MNRFYLIIFIFCINFCGIHAHEIKVKIFSTLDVSQTLVSPKTGFFHLVACNEHFQIIDTISEIHHDDQVKLLHFKQSGKLTSVHLSKEHLGDYEGLILFAADTSHNFIINVNNTERWYDGHLRIRVFKNSLQIVNQVPLEQYVAGVVESEGGRYNEMEYFKAQAVLARTFALRNWKKHMSEGYNLKDDVSSQVYFNRAYYTHAAMIYEAVNATRDSVLVLQETCKPILAVFHANSGGQTANSEEAWHNKVPYLRSQPDPYSVGRPSYQWTKKIPKAELENYLAKKLNVKVSPELQEAIANFQQPNRKSVFTFQGKTVPLRDVRFAFKLRSTFFSIEAVGNFYELNGLGYGHGVGLSQDGAINMASKGFSYKDILYFYYKQVELENLNYLDSVDEYLKPLDT